MELDADFGDDFQARLKSHRSGAEKPRVPSSRRVVGEDDEGSPCHDDISLAFSNFEKPPSRSKAGNRLAGHRGFERESGSDSISDFGSPDLVFGSTDSGLLDLGLSDHGLGPVYSGLPLVFGLEDHGPTHLSDSGSKCGERDITSCCLSPFSLAAES